LANAAEVLGRISLWPFNPNFNSALNSYPSLCLHQLNLRLNEPVVAKVEFFFDGVFQLWQRNVFNRADDVPKVALYFFSFFKSFFF
jgi:hypothetical protein